MNNKGFVLLKKYPHMVRAQFFILFPLLFVTWIIYQIYLIDVLLKTSGKQVVNVDFNSIPIGRDENNATLINAITGRDVYFAMSYLHAQDILFRTLNFFEKINASKNYQCEQALKPLKAYVPEINAWFKVNSTLPIEFTLEGVEPKPCTVDDTLTWNIVGSNIYSGSSMLANDSPAGFKIPLLWYPVKQKEIHLNITGMSLVSLSAIIISRNQNKV